MHRRTNRVRRNRNCARGRFEPGNRRTPNVQGITTPIRITTIQDDGDESDRRSFGVDASPIIGSGGVWVARADMCVLYRFARGTKRPAAVSTMVFRVLRRVVHLTPPLSLHVPFKSLTPDSDSHSRPVRSKIKTTSRTMPPTPEGPYPSEWYPHVGNPPITNTSKIISSNKDMRRSPFFDPSMVQVVCPRPVRLNRGIYARNTAAMERSLQELRAAFTPEPPLCD